MGKMLGAFADDQELDRPDLNKCPDCGCYFASDTCPLCKKVCPEEMRAGNRAPAKKSKKRRTGSGRVTFISWYHRWWFIILMLALFPLVGIILAVTSPHRTWKKVLCIGLYVMLPVLIAGSMFLGTILIGEIFGQPPVDTSLTREEYVAVCQTVTPEDYYRTPDAYTDIYMCISLEVEEKRITDDDTYYICHDPENQDFVIVFRDCLQDGKQNFITGDLLTVYGEPTGESAVVSVNDNVYDAPCLNAAYADKQ